MEFIAPSIQSHFAQMKLWQTFDSIENLKERLDSSQKQIRESHQTALQDLIEERNAARDGLRSLLQEVYPWLRVDCCERDEVAACDFQKRLALFLDDLNRNDAKAAHQANEVGLKHYQGLVERAGKCVESYKMKYGNQFNATRELSKKAAESVVLRASKLGLGDTFYLAVTEPEKLAELAHEMSELRNALQEELNVLSEDNLYEEALEMLIDINSTLHHLAETSVEGSDFSTSARLSMENFNKTYNYVLLGTKMPDLLHLEKMYEKLVASRKAMESLNSLKKARDNLEAEDSEGATEFFGPIIAKQERILSEGTPFDLSKRFRHKLAETLQHAEDHYPELLKDKTWLERLHVNTEGLLEVARSDLWLANVAVSDFRFNGAPLASRGGKTVQKVFDNFGETLVLKLFQLSNSNQSTSFYKQIANLGKVVSQHVIHIIGAFVDTSHGMPRGCIIMPFYEQGDLAQWISEHPREDKNVRDRLAMGLLVGVADLHVHSIVHCDIKPENIFLTSNGTPLLGDFDGIKVADCTATYTSLQATPRYVAPELRSGHVNAFKTSMDMYSVGVVLEDLYPDPTITMKTLIDSLKATDPDTRLSAREALQHEAFGFAKVSVEVCIVCMEENALFEGTSCEDGDFLCKDCVAHSVEAAAKPQACVSVDSDGTMACMKPGCDKRISGQEITRLAPNALNHLMLIARMKAENEAAIWAEQEIRRHMETFLQTDGLTRDTERHLKHIQEKILNASCPHCNTCFDQFDGCCAVECGSDKCGHYFCAWCLEYSSPDSDACHTHVRTCSRKLGNDPFFPDSFEQVRKAWRLLRADRLREYWSVNIHDLSSVLKEQLGPLLTADLVGPDFILE